MGTHSLVFRSYADRAEGEDLFFGSIFIDKPVFCIHDRANHQAVLFDDKIKLRDKVFMRAKNMSEIMFIAAGNV